MTEADKITALKDNHLSEWLKVRQTIESKLSGRQSVFCICGKLATGLHETSCRKFQKTVDKTTVNELAHLL